MQEAVDVAVQLKYERIREESTTANQQFLDSIDDGMKKIIKEQVKKEVSKIIPKVERKLVTINSSSEVRLQRQLYKALVGGTGGSKEEGQGIKKKSQTSTSAPSETTTKTTGKTTGVRKLVSQDEQAEEGSNIFLTGFKNLRVELPFLIHAWNKSVLPVKKTVQLGLRTYHIKWIEDLVPNSMWSQTIVKYDKFALWGISHWGKKRRQFYAFATSRESARDVYSKRRIIAVTKVEIVEWHDYKHLDWITVRRDDDVLYKFKEGDFHRLRIQDIEDMLLLLVQGKVTNLSVEERIAFNVSLRMFTRRVVIQRRVEDLQLGVESYQKKLNLTKPDTYRSNLRRQDAYTPYSDPRGFIYENKDKKNRLMRIDELHKFSDGTLDDVRTALNDRLKGIRMEYLPQTFWSQRDKANARAMIQAIDKRLKTRRIMRSLERFVGGRPYGGDLRLLQRTI
ncbi:hypothetical protein Tco_1107903 [Tanacetum coccineum]